MTPDSMMGGIENLQSGGHDLSEHQSASAFQFDADQTAPAGSHSITAGVVVQPNDAPGRLRRAIEAAGETAYHWHIESDEISWSGNVGDVLGCDPSAIANGRCFAALLDGDNFTSRYDTVMRTPQIDQGHGVPFQIEYLFRPESRTGRLSVWLEDHGKWFAGPDGRPAEVLGTVRRIDDRHKRDQHLSFLGNCDPLTGMMNRGRMAEALGEAMTVAGRDGNSCAFVIAAINNLAVVNEAYGFEVADEVIVSMGRRLREVVRGGDAIARYSGAKFGMILNQCGDKELEIAVERFLELARESVIETAHGPVWAQLSIGGLALPKHATDASTAMALAEEALSEARRLPSDGHVIYRPSAQRTARRKLNAHSATEIVRCLKEDRFRLAFQPIVSATTGLPVFHEALLRMTDTAGEVIAAAHLIPIAEQLGLVRLIDRAVVQMAITALHKYPDARLAINISGTTATDPRWYPQITSILANNRGVTNRLIIEITETVTLSDIKQTQCFVEALRGLGCSIAVDDFGAGFTSFRHLRGLTADILKIDGSFCQNLANNADNQYFVRSMIELAHAFDIQIVAEWVENEEDAGLLRQWQADFLQGNLFGAATLEAPWQAAPDSINFMTGEIITADAPTPALEPPAPEAAASIDNLSTDDPVGAFEADLPNELSKLRQAIAALDRSFRAPSAHAAEPSFADLASDSVRQAAG